MKALAFALAVFFLLVFAERRADRREERRIRKLDLLVRAGLWSLERGSR